VAWGPQLKGPVVGRPRERQDESWGKHTMNPKNTQSYLDNLEGESEDYRDRGSETNEGWAEVSDGLGDSLVDYDDLGCPE
jgi:hypothetical protein